MRTAAFTLVRSLQSIHTGRLFTQGAHVEGATVGLLPKPALNANGVQATGDAVADAVDSAMACQRKAGSVAEPSARRNDRPAARRDARRAAFFAARKTVSTVTRARQTARASLKTFDEGARTHEENKHSPRCPSGTRSPAPLHALASEIL